MAAPTIKYLVFDVESVADGKLVAGIRFPGEQIDPQAAIRRYRDDETPAALSEPLNARRMRLINGGVGCFG